MKRHGYPDNISYDVHWAKTRFVYKLSVIL